MDSLKFYRELGRDIIANKEFIKDYENMLLGNISETPAIIYKRLLESASIFACSEDETHKIIALKIASKIIESKDSAGAFKAACQLIFTRLGIFPTFKMAVEQYNIKDYFNILDGKLKDNITFSLRAEILKKLNSNIYNIGKETVYLTDYQVELLHNLKKKRNISISAPTSAGKSYILTRYIVECLIHNKKFIAVYIVPTRALITQVQRDFNKALRDHHVENVEIYTGSWEIKDGEQSKVILVLTQERLHAFEGRAKNHFKIDLLIIDEAQNIEGGARGILLEDSIQQVREWNINVQVVFIAPFIENPEEFQRIFPSSKLESIKTKFSPVSQNIIFIDIKGNNIERSYISQEMGRKIKLDELRIEEKVPENYRRKAWVAANLVEDGPTMVYCNGPKDCRDTANALFDLMDVQDISKNVLEVIKFLEKNVHPDYYLIDNLKKGVGYHYGKMPPTVRLAMELLFSKKYINLICCTSTLMEGINLPAKNIVVYKPKYGKQTHITDLDLMNLVGRAGRLMKDFFGNIYCIDNDEWKGPKLGVDRNGYEIESSMENVIINKREEIIDNLRTNLKSRGKNDDVEAAVTRFLINEIRKGKIEIVEQLIAQDKSVAIGLAEISTYVKTIVSEINLPAEIILRNRSIDPRLQNNLYKKLKEIESPPILRHPARGNIYADLEKIFPLLNECFNKEYYEKYTTYHALFANWWVNEKTMGQIIDSSLNYIKKKDDLDKLTEKRINEEIENIFDTANIKMKFELCRDISCYIDILQYVLGNELSDVDIIANISSYIEMGAFKPTTLTLINKGFTRTVAILISRMMPQNIHDFDLCEKFISENRESINKEIPAILMQELIG